MVIYEVNIQFDANIQNNFLSWLKSHANKMLKFNGFERYNIYKDEKDALCFSIHYYIKSIIYLENYLKNHSTNMRLKGEKEFQNKMSINRRVLSKL